MVVFLLIIGVYFFNDGEGSFITQICLWVRVVKVLYGLDDPSSPLILRKICLGPWNGITRMLANLKDKGFGFHALYPIRIGDGVYTSFWQDIWIGDTLLVVSFHRVLAFNNHCTSIVRDRIAIGWDMVCFRRLPRGGIE